MRPQPETPIGALSCRLRTTELVRHIRGQRLYITNERSTSSAAFCLRVCVRKPVLPVFRHSPANWRTHTIRQSNIYFSEILPRTGNVTASTHPCMNSNAILSGFSLSALFNRQRFWTFLPWLEGEVEGLFRAGSFCGDTWKLMLGEVNRSCTGTKGGGGGGGGGRRGGIREVGWNMGWQSWALMICLAFDEIFWVLSLPSDDLRQNPPSCVDEPVSHLLCCELCFVCQE